MRCGGEPSGVSGIVRGKRRLYEALEQGSNCRNRYVGQFRKKGGLEGELVRLFRGQDAGLTETLIG